MPKHSGHSNVRKPKPGLSGSMSRNVIVSPHFWQQGLLITFTNTAYPPDRQLHPWTRFAQILCSEGDGCLETCWTPAEQSPTSFWKIKFAQCCPLQNPIVCEQRERIACQPLRKVNHASRFDEDWQLRATPTARTELSIRISLATKRSC